MAGTIIYQIIPRLWGNGRFSGIDAATLGHIKSLGVDYVWYTGIPRHASGEDFVKGDPGCPYAVECWTDTNPYLADNEKNRMDEFEELCKLTHSFGLKLLTDFIPNHVARNYTGPAVTYPWCDGDWTDTLKLNWTDPRTAEALIEALRFWAGKGVDGFRCDMVELVPPEALGAVIRRLKEEFPALLFVAEVYGRENYSRYVSEVGFDFLYDKSGSYDILRGIMEGHRSARELTVNWQSLGWMQPHMLNFLENHDEQRLSAWTRTAGRGLAAAAFAALFNTAGFMLYFGQEAGEGAREAADSRTSIFNWCKPAEVGLLAGFIHGDNGKPELLDSYRDLCALASSDLFRNGDNWDLCYCNADRMDLDRQFAFLRYDSGTAALVVCNFSDEAAGLQIRIPSELGKYQRDAVPMNVPGCGYGVYFLE